MIVRMLLSHLPKGMYIQQSFFASKLPGFPESVRSKSVHKPSHKRHPLHQPTPEKQDRTQSSIYPITIAPHPSFISKVTNGIYSSTLNSVLVCGRSMEEGVRDLPNARRLYPNLPPYAMHIRLSS